MTEQFTPEQVLETQRLELQLAEVAKEQTLEAARIEAASRLERSQIRAQASVAFVVGAIALAVIIASAILEDHNRTAPQAFGSLLPLLAGGLTTMLGVQISSRSKK